MYSEDVNFNGYLFKDVKMKEIIYLAERAATTECTVLITGESGTGKSLIAKYIHDLGERKNKPFISLNCAAISENLLESELFGYVPGAFTGALKAGKLGLVEMANGGTLFLDEIGEVPLSLQTKFLELVQEQSFTPVGGIAKKKINVQIIAATNAKLEQLIIEKKFREDLYYRLKIIELKLPPLRERQQDIEGLIIYFFNKFIAKYKIPRILTNSLLDLMKAYYWPGNIRELENVIERLIIVSKNEVIQESDLSDDIINKSWLSDLHTESSIPRLDEHLEEVEKEIILRAFKVLGSSYKVADKLGISQSRAIRLYKKYNERIR